MTATISLLDILQIRRGTTVCIVDDSAKSPMFSFTKSAAKERAVSRSCRNSRRRRQSLPAPQRTKRAPRRFSASLPKETNRWTNNVVATIPAPRRIKEDSPPTPSRGTSYVSTNALPPTRRQVETRTSITHGFAAPRKPVRRASIEFNEPAVIDLSALLSLQDLNNNTSYEDEDDSISSGYSDFESPIAQKPRDRELMRRLSANAADLGRLVAQLDCDMEDATPLSPIRQQRVLAKSA